MRNTTTQMLVNLGLGLLFCVFLNLDLKDLGPILLVGFTWVVHTISLIVGVAYKVQGDRMLEFFKRAELCGSRYNNAIVSPDTDWDWIVFTNNKEERERFKLLFKSFGNVLERDDDFWVHYNNIDLHVWPEAKRELLIAAYEYRKRTGCSKQQMIEYLYRVQKQGGSNEATDN